MSMVFQEGSVFLEIILKFNQFRPIDTNTFHAFLHAQIDFLLGEQRYAKTHYFYSLQIKGASYQDSIVCVFCINLFHK